MKIAGSPGLNMSQRARGVERAVRRLVLLAALLAVAGCNFSLGGDEKYPEARRQGDTGPVYGERPTIFGGEGGALKDASGGPQDPGGGGVGVNSLLWRASLDTISFMPLVSADPFGGVIITDWYSPPQTPEERFKVNVFILGRALRADGIRVSVFRQQSIGGSWSDAPVALNTATDLENAILTRARELRMSGLQQ